MTKVITQNPISRLLHSLGDIAEGLGITKPIPDSPKMDDKERAVRIYDIWGYVQKELDEAGTRINEYGDLVSAGYVCDVYLDNTGAFAIFTSDGKLYKVPVIIDEQSQISTGEAQEVVMDFTPVTRGLTVTRQKDGRIRWVAAPACTAILNRSGEIDSRDLFDSFVEYIERTGEYPSLDFFHLGADLVLGKADLVFRDGVNYVATGLFDDSDEARAVAAAIEKEPDYWGLSIQYLPTEEPEMLRSVEGIEIPVFRQGINHFISILPESTAAAILTNISTKEVNRMNKIQEVALKKALGSEELFNSVAEKLNSVNRTAESGAVITRNASAPATTAPATATPAKPAVKTPAAKSKKEWTAEDVKSIVTTPEFRSVLEEVFPEIKASAEAGEGEDTEEDDTEATPEGVEGTPESESRSVAEAILELAKELKEDRKMRSAQAQQVNVDTPAKIQNQQPMFRARAAVTPIVVNAQGAGLNLADVAAATLEKMGAVEEE